MPSRGPRLTAALCSGFARGGGPWRFAAASVFTLLPQPYLKILTYRAKQMARGGGTWRPAPGKRRGPTNFVNALPDLPIAPEEVVPVKSAQARPTIQICGFLLPHLARHCA